MHGAAASNQVGIEGISMLHWENVGAVFGGGTGGRFQNNASTVVLSPLNDEGKKNARGETAKETEKEGIDIHGPCEFEQNLRGVYGYKRLYGFIRACHFVGQLSCIVDATMHATNCTRHSVLSCMFCCSRN